MTDLDIIFMREALREAEKAGACGEVPVGAVLVWGEEILSRGHNSPIGEKDPTAHAEIQAMRQAARSLGNYRLTGCRLYVTLEPCLMCAGAIVQARIAEVVFGALDEKNGAIVSRLEALSLPWLNHSTLFRGGVLEQESRRLLQDFFQERRHRAREAKNKENSPESPESVFFSGK